MSRVVILYRGKEFEEQELASASKYFFCTNSRMDIKADDLVIARYSCLPFYEEQARDINKVGAKLINSHHQHIYVADLKNWYEDLKEFTFKTYHLNDILQLEDNKSYILKGETNSKKFLFSTHMFAKTKKDVGAVLGRLFDDSLISTQDIYIREFVPLFTYFVSLHELPITKEFRFFVGDGQVISGGFYWSSHIEDVKWINNGVIPSPDEVPSAFLQEVIKRVGDQSRFYVIDVGLTVTNEWKVIELNEGQMSGLSENDPDVLYGNLAKLLL